MIRKICILVGACLLAAAISVLIFWQWDIRSSAEKSEYFVNILQTLIPEPQGSIPEERRDNTMPTLSVNNIDFVGILQIPDHGSSLPVCATWSQPSKYPCRFDGSIYDRTMKIGGTSQSGQYDFYREISVGDTVLFTDMVGNQFSYNVTNIHYAKTADQTALQRKDAALTLFVKNIYSFEYIIISCDVAS